MGLCSDRPNGGFGPYYSSTHILTTCFDHVVFIPLGAWLFLLFTALLFLHRYAFRSQRSRKTDPTIAADDKLDPVPGRFRRTFAPGGGKWSRTRRALLILSTALLVALLAMHALQIARLAASSSGIGLMPFTFIPIVLVLLSHFVPTRGWSKTQIGTRGSARPHGWVWMSGVTGWALWMVLAYGIELWSLSKGPEVFNDKYPYSDRLIDSIVILCVYWAWLLIYLHQMLLEYVQHDWRLFA